MIPRRILCGVVLSLAFILGCDRSRTLLEAALKTARWLNTAMEGAAGIGFYLLNMSCGFESSLHFQDTHPIAFRSR